jgi:hypothetical protein
MWPVGGPYPNAPWGVPIKPIPALSSMGNYEAAPEPDVIHPRADPLWSNLYRITAAGALNRVAPFGPSAFGNDLGPEPAPTTGERVRNMLPFILGVAGIAGVMLLMSR